MFWGRIEICRACPDTISIVKEELDSTSFHWNHRCIPSMTARNFQQVSTLRRIFSVWLYYYYIEVETHY